MRKTTVSVLLSVLLALSLTACSKQETQAGSVESAGSQPSVEDTAVETEETELPAAGQLTVRFGDDGELFTLYLEDNDTAAAIARHVGSSSWRLPIYHYDDYEGWEVMQYYDIPSRYEIPSNAETVTSEQAGQVYYSEPNRIVLFYQDGEIFGEYTLVGHFDATEDFISAVESNPVLEGWNTKMVNIRVKE